MLCFVLMSFWAGAQLFPVTVHVGMTQQSLSPYIHQWAQPGSLGTPFQISLQFNDLNSSPVNASVRFRLDGTNVSIVSNPNTPTIVTLHPGQLLTLDEAAFASLLSPDRLSTSQNQFGQTPLPEGVYTLCVEVYELARDTKISSTGCAVLSIQNFDLPEWNLLQPTTVLPTELYTLGQVSTIHNPLFSFNWSPRHPQVFMAEYTLEIFEVPAQTTMTYEQVVNSTLPFFSTTTIANTYLYQPDDPPLDTLQTYIARLRVRDPLNVYQFVNNGIGPIGTFAVLGDGNDDGQESIACGDPEHNPSLHLESYGDTIHLSWLMPEGFENQEVLIQTMAPGGEEWQSQGWYSALTGEVRLSDFEVLPQRMRLGIDCGAESTMWWSNTTSAIPFPSVLPDSCGIPFDLLLENQDPLPFQLVNGDSIMVGDFVCVLEDVIFDEIGYHGAGYISTPVFDLFRPRMAVELRNVRVNTDFQMISGQVSTVYDEENNLMIDLGGLSDLFQEIGGIDDIAYDPILISDSIVDVRINVNGEVEIITLDSLGNTVVKTYPIDLEPPQGISNILVRSGYENAQDVFVQDQVPAAKMFVGEDGREYGRVGDAIFSESDRLTRDLEGSMGNLGRVYFQRVYTEPGGLDHYFPQALAEDFESIDEYKVPWKALLLGTSEKVKIDTRDSEADSLYFETHSGYELQYQVGSEGIEIEVPALNEGDLDAVYALGKKGGTEIVQTLGAMNIVGYELKLLTLNVIPVNGAEVPVSAYELAQALNKIYNPAIASWQVKVHDPVQIDYDLNGDGVLQTGKNSLGQYHEEMREVARFVKDLDGIEKGTKDAPILNIVVVPDLEGEYDGYMPRGRDLGFVREGSANFARVVAHELGHGAFGLRHSWEEYPDLPKNTSNNLMDYGDGTYLTKRQWDQIHTPLAVLGMFETSEGGGSVGVVTKGKPIAEYFPNLITDDLYIPFLTPGHQRIILPKTAEDPVFFHGIESDEMQEIYTGALLSFTYGNARYIAKIYNGQFYGYFAGNNRFPSTVPEDAGTRSKEWISLVYPCDAKIFAQSFLAPEIEHSQNEELGIVSEMESSLRLFTKNTKVEEKVFENIEGLFNESQTGISQEEIEMTKRHCGLETVIIVSKIAQYRNRYPEIFNSFTKHFDTFFGAVEADRNDPYNISELGQFEQRLKDDDGFGSERLGLWESNKYQFYIHFLQDLIDYIEGFEEKKRACLADLENIDLFDLYNCIKYFSDDEVEEIDAISKFLIISRFADALHAGNRYEQEIIRCLKHIKDEDQADQLYVLLRNDLTSDDPQATIKRLFAAVDDDFLIGSEDRRNFIDAVVGLCNRSSTYVQHCNSIATDDDLERLFYIYVYESVWQSLWKDLSPIGGIYMKSMGHFDDNGTISLRTQVRRYGAVLHEFPINVGHALDPIYFINMSSLGQISNYDDLGTIVPAIVGGYAVTAGDQKTAEDLVEAGIDVVTLTVGVGAIQMGISGLRRAIILADMVSAGTTLTLNVTDADKRLNEDALNFLRSIALISGLIGAADLVDVENVLDAFAVGKRTGNNMTAVDNATLLKREAENLCDQVIGQQDMNRLAEIGSDRLQSALYQSERLLEASILSGDAQLTVKLRLTREKLIAAINDLDAAANLHSVLLARFPVLGRAQYTQLHQSLTQLIRKDESLRGLVELGHPLNSAAKGLPGAEQLRMFSYLLDNNPLGDVLSTYPHLFRFEPWSWPTGPPSLLDELSLLRKDNPTIFDDLLKEGGHMVLGLDLSATAAANTSKVQQLLIDLTKNNDLLDFFGEGVGGVNSWEAVRHLAPEIKLNTTNLEKLSNALKQTDYDASYFDNLLQTKLDPQKFIDDFVGLIGDNGKFIDNALEVDYGTYLTRKARQGRPPRDRSDWKQVSDYMKNESPTARGNAFDELASADYQFNQLNLVQPDGSFTRLDSYVPSNLPITAGEIVSRKAVDLIDGDMSKFMGFITELKSKYARGTKIRSNAYPMLDGKTIQGEYFIEIPASNQYYYDIQKFIDAASAEGVSIKFRPE